MSDTLKHEASARRITFRLSEVFPPSEPLTLPLLRLMVAVNDVRHIQKLLIMANERALAASELEKIVLNGEILHLDRLLCGHLYEAGIAFRGIDSPHPQLADAAVHGMPEYEEALLRLREAYATDPRGAFHHSFLKEVRDQFGFHYHHEAFHAKLQDFIRQGSFDGTLIAAEFSGLSRYVLADHLSIAMLQDLLDAKLHDCTPK